MTRMTDEEFDVQQNLLLERLPEELRPVLSHMAYERGHAYGYAEVIGILGNLVNDLETAVLAYGSRMERQGRDWAGA